MRENWVEERNPKFLDSKTANFQGLEKVCQKKSKIPWFWNSKFPMMRERLPKNLKFPKSYQQLPGWEKNVETKKIQNSLNTINIFPDERKMLRQKKSKIP